MQYNRRKTICGMIFFSGALETGLARPQLPDGLMLNMDFQRVKDGLIPSKTLYPLYVPIGPLSIETINNRSMLGIQFGQGLDIPHSSMLNPDGKEWIVTVRVFALTDGIILSQTDGEFGYVIYLKDGAIRTILRTGDSAITLKESPSRGITDGIKSWITIELRIKPDMAMMSLNRNRAAFVRLNKPLISENLQIRLGNHRSLPGLLKFTPDATPDGFTGAISSFKLLRQ
jgi:hypothetical protein